MRPLRIGVDATTWWNDRGFGRFTREIMNALLERSDEFHYTLLVDRKLDAALPSGAQVHRVPTHRTVTESAVGSGSRSVRDLWALSRDAARGHFDLFFFPAVYSYFPIAAGTPCVVTFHDTIAERYPALMFPTWRNRLSWRAKVGLARRRARRFLTVSKASARDLESILGIPAERIDVVNEAAAAHFRPLPESVAAQAARRRYEIPAGAPLLLYVGGLNRHKNLLGLLRCLPQVLESHPKAHLAIVGDTSGRGFYDNAEELQDFVRERPPLQARVRFTGYVSDDELVALYNGADLLVLPSLWEGFGLPAVEAMACGVPVAASRRGSLPEIVGEAGAFFDPESTEEMAAVLSRVLADCRHSDRLRRAALERAATYTWERAALQVEGCFRRCLADPE